MLVWLAVTNNTASPANAITAAPSRIAPARGPAVADLRFGGYTNASSAPASGPNARASVPRYAWFWLPVQREPHHRHPRQDDEADGEGAQPLEPDPPPEHEQQGPHDVELLFDRERPQVLEGLAAPGVGRDVDVRDAVDDVPPVLAVEAEREVAAEPPEILVVEDRDDEPGDEHHRDQRGPQATDPPDPEVPQVDALARLRLGEQQARDQVPADHEEHLDAEEPAAQQRSIGAVVVEQHRDHRDRAQPVEPGEIRQSDA